MRKTKENSARPLTGVSSDVRDAVETANEERADAIGGENSTEGLGSGFDDADSDAERTDKAQSSADGPVSGASNDPPFEPRTGRKKRAKQRGVTLPDSPSNHAAAHSSKTI